MATEVLGLNPVVTSLHVIDRILNKLVIMNKKLNSLLMILVLVSTNAQSNELQGLFGLDLNKNITNYVSQGFVIENSSKHPETNAGYRVVNITGSTPKANPSYSNYFAVIDKFEVIQGISAQNLSTGLSACLTQMNQLKKYFERKYRYNFASDKNYVSGFEANRVFTRTLADNYLQLSCLQQKGGTVFGRISIYTPKMSKALDEFYDSGL